MGYVRMSSQAFHSHSMCQHIPAQSAGFPGLTAALLLFVHTSSANQIPSQ